ncbi:MAG: hypothetical protein ACF8LK_00605 [Phycisphaerales bacterium JB041]
MLVSVALLWALTWSAFVVASVIGEPWRGWVIAAAFFVGVWSLALGAWRWPRAGGLVMTGVGLWSWSFFHSRAAMVGLSLPAIMLGLGFLWLGAMEARRRRARRAAPPAAAGPSAPDTPPETTPDGGD